MLAATRFPRQPGVAALIGAAAFLAMWRYQWGVIPVIGGCGALGFIATGLT